MKKLLFMVAAMLVMVSCGSKEDKLTPEQKAENFAGEFVESVLTGDRETVAGLMLDVLNYTKTLDEQTEAAFIDTFCERVDDLGNNLTEEQNEKAMMFLVNNLDLFEDLNIFE